MELPKRARTVNWESGVLTLDGEKQFEVPELTVEIMEQLAGYTLVGFHVKSYPVTDELLAPFAGHKSMATSAWRTVRSLTPVSPFFPLCPSCVICCWTVTPPSTAAVCPLCKAASWTF